MADYIVQNEPELVDITIDKVKNLEQTAGQATDKIMSQKAVTDIIYNPDTGGIKIDDSGMTGISIGNNSNAAGDASVAIGTGATVTDTYPLGIALGVNSNCSGQYSVALGYYSKASENGVVSVGQGSGSANYGTRRIINVKDPVNAQDAATKNYVDTAILTEITNVLAGGY